jgi:hypothetical protein
MNPASKDLCAMLAAAGLGLSFGTNLFIGWEPTAPDNAVTIYDTPGFSPNSTLTKGEETWLPSIQVRVRNRDYLMGWTLINSIKEVLHSLAHETWGGTVYDLIQCAQEPFLLNYDEHGRPLFVCNFDIQRQ